MAVDINGDDKHVSISVKDSGVGIPAEDIPHLFQKFYRVDNSDTREIGGTGLGLYLCRKLAESMSGHLHVESEHKKGSTFFLDLPRISADEASQKMSEEDAKNNTDVDASMPVVTDNQPEITTPPPIPQVTPEQNITLPPSQPAPPTLAEIENRIKAERSQLSIPERKS